MLTDLFYTSATYDDSESTDTEYRRWLRGRRRRATNSSAGEGTPRRQCSAVRRARVTQRDTGTTQLVSHWRARACGPYTWTYVCSICHSVAWLINLYCVTSRPAAYLHYMRTVRLSTRLKKRDTADLQVAVV